MRQNYILKEIEGQQEITIGDAIYTPIDFASINPEELLKNVKEDFNKMFVSAQGNINFKHALIKAFANHIGV